jgi:predicted dehydrogenase
MAATEPHLSWGILGTGRIAHTFAEALARSRTGRLAAVSSRQQASADAFAKKFGSLRAHGAYEELLADPAVRAVYISTPHPFHAEWCIKAARAKKHILCEKPLTLNHSEALTVVKAVRENGVFLMEGFMYRCHPQTAKLLELIRAGAIGQVGLIKATFGFNGGFRPEHRLYNNELGGGAILDVGCYTMSISRLVAGAALDLPFANPVQLNGFAQLHPETGTDLYSTAMVRFPRDIFAQLSTAVGLDLDSGLQVFGTTGSLCVKNPFTMAREGGETVILHTKGDDDKTEIRVHTSDYLFALEADAVGDAVARGKLESPFMSIEDTLGNMAALDAWRRSAQFLYRSEKRDKKM